MHRNPTFPAPAAPNNSFAEYVKMRQQSHQLGELISSIKPKHGTFSMMSGAVISTNKDLKSSDQKMSRRVSDDHVVALAHVSHAPH